MSNEIFEQLETEIKKVKFIKGLRRNVNDEKYNYIHFGKIIQRYKGITECPTNKKFPKVYNLLQKLIKEHDPKFSYTSIIINKNNVCKPHTDKNNIFKSYIFSLGNYKGGDLFIEDKKYNIHHKLIKFDGSKTHYSTPFEGQRYSVVYFTNKVLNLGIIKVKNFTFEIRKKTTDETVIKEVIEKEIYLKNGIMLDENQVWLDIGANIGTFTVLISDKVKKVFSFECEPENIGLLRKNIKHNNLKNVTVKKYAVTNEGTEDKLYLTNTHYNKYQHSLINRKNKKHIKIQSKSFEKILTKNITCVKMDIEGSEMDILENVKNWKNVTQLIFEWSFRFDNNVNRLRNVITNLKKHFNFIKYSKSVDKYDQWNFFPEGVLVYCLKN